MKRLAAIGLGVLALMAGATGVYNMKSGSDWKQTTGRVLRSEVRTVDRQTLGMDTEHGRFNYEADVEYEYEVDGKKYHSTRLYARLPAIFARKPFADQVVARFPAGAEVAVYYKPEQADFSCLLQMRLGRGMIVFLILIIALAIGLIAIACLMGMGKLKN